MKIRGTSKSLWRISLPLIFAGFSESVVDVTDAIFLAHYGLVELGAIAIADSFYELLIVATMGLVEGLQIVISRRAGQEDAEGIGRTFQQGLYLLGISSLFTFLVLRFVFPTLTPVLVESGEVRSAVDAFLRIIAFNVLFDAANFAYGAFYVGIGRTRILVSATIVLACTNIVLDYLLIFGKMGFPSMGIEGAAIASLTAELTTLVFVTVYTWRLGHIRRFKLFARRGWDTGLTRRLLRLSSPVVLDGLVAALQWSVFFVLVERLGPAALAASNIVYTSHVVLWISLDGLSDAMSTSTGNLLGQERADRISKLLRAGISQAYLLVLPVAALTLVFPEGILSVFTTEAEEVMDSIASLRVVGLALLVAVPAEMLMGAISGSGDTRSIFRIECTVSLFVVAYTWVATMVCAWPLPVVWLSLVLAWVLRLALSYQHMRTRSWSGIEV